MDKTASATALLARRFVLVTAGRNGRLQMRDIATDAPRAKADAARSQNVRSTSKAKLHFAFGLADAGDIRVFGRVDCVPVDCRRRVADSFTRRTEHGRPIGRDAAAMPGFCARVCEQATALGVLAAGPRRPIHFDVTSHEQISSVSVASEVAARTAMRHRIAGHTAA